MLSSDKRLNLKKDFSWVASGQRAEDHFYKLFVKQGQNTSARVGIAISSAYFKSAVERNRARRLTSNILESLYNSLGQSVNLIVMPKKAVLTTELPTLRQSLEKLIKSQGVINDRTNL